MNRIIKYLNNNMVLLLALSFFEPYIFVAGYYKEFDVIDNIYSGLKIAAFLYICFFLVLNRKNDTIKKAFKLLLLLIMLQVTIMASTAINNGDLFRSLGHSITIMTAFVMGISIYNTEISAKCTDCLRKYLFFCFLINMCSIMIIDAKFPFMPANVQEGVYFWGIDRRFVYLYFPLVFYEALYEINKYQKIKPRFYILLVVLLVSIAERTKTTIFGIVPFFLILIVRCRKIRPYMTVIIYSVVNYCVAYASGLGGFTKFIENVLHKSMTFSGRTYIWEAVQDSFYEHPLIGIGYQTGNYDAQLFSSHSPHDTIEYTSVSHAHNVLIDTLYRGGILAGALLLSFWAELLIIIGKTQDEIIKTLFFISVLAVFVMSIFDNFDVAPFFFIYGTICSCSLSRIRIRKKNER